MSRRCVLNNFAYVIGRIAPRMLYPVCRSAHIQGKTLYRTGPDRSNLLQFGEATQVNPPACIIGQMPMKDIELVHSD